MKKSALFVATTALLIAGNVCAKHNMGGGFTGPGSESVTVAEALKMRDDTPVTLTGHIEKKSGGDRYVFKDNTGTVIVEIDDDEWNGLNVTPETRLTLSGEVDKDWSSLKIDVKSISLAQ